MNVDEIIIKNELTTREMEFVVEQYIFEKKGKKVDINTLNHPLANAVPPPMNGIILQQQFQLLDTAYQTACVYFFENLKPQTT
jgi:hypothetical protein